MQRIGRVVLTVVLGCMLAGCARMRDRDPTGGQPSEAHSVRVSDPTTVSNSDVWVTGYVVRPGTYEWHRSITLKMVVSRAGKFTFGTDERVRLYRNPGGFANLGGRFIIQRSAGKEFIVIDMDKIRPDEEPDVFLKPGDWIDVRQSK